MVCRACGKESADDFSFCPHCGKQNATRTVCPSCTKESAAEFSFCPHCGNAFVAGLPIIESADPQQEVKPVTEVATEELAPTGGVPSDKSNRIGTWVFGAFSVIALLVSIIKGLVPIYLAESAIWAGAAWYWHKKKTHSELAKAIVIILAALIAIGEVIQIAKQFGSEPEHTRANTPNPFDNAFASQYPTITGETQDKANSEETHLKAEPKPRKDTPTRLEATVSCDVVAYDRDKYGDGDPKAIATLHQGDTVPYIGHVTIGDEDIIRVQGRRGYVSGCVDVNLSKDTADRDEANLKSETHAGLEATITCDAIVWDRDKYGDGDPMAIASVHEGDIVPYVGHVTIGDQDIIRIHGRRGYVSGCVDVEQ